MSDTYHDTPHAKRRKSFLQWRRPRDGRWYKRQLHKAERRLWRGYGRERHMLKWRSEVSLRGW